MLTGFVVGRQAGYSRGSYDVTRLVLEMRETPPDPPRFTKGGI